MRYYGKKIAASALSGAVAVGFACASSFAQEVAPTASPAIPAQVQPPSESPSLGESLEAQVQETFEKCKGAIVRIEASQGIALQSGTGFFIDPTGTVCTHFFVVAGGESFTVLFEGKKLNAKVLIADPRSGVALLKVEDVTTPFLSAANLADVKVASPIMVIGYCKDLPLAPGLGLVAGFDKEYLGGKLPTMHIRASIPAEPGQGGAPVVNFRGEVVGIVALQLAGGRSSYVLPMQAAEKVHRDYMKYGARRDGWMGLDVDFYDPLTLQAPRISRFIPGSPVKGMGIQIGDELLRVGDFPIETGGDLANASFFLTAGEPVKILVRREGKEIEVEIKPELHPGVPPEIPVIVPGMPMSSHPNDKSTPAPQ